MQSERLYGKVLIHQPLTFKVLTSLIVLVTLFIVGYLVQGSYARRESVIGYLVPDKGLVKMFAASSGLVKKIHVEEGQQVKKGDLLISITTIKNNNLGTDKDELVLQELNRQKENVKGLQQKEKSTAKLEQERISQKIKSLKNEQKSINRSIALLRKRVGLSNKKLVKIKTLHRSKFISANIVDDLEQQTLELQSQLLALQQQKFQMQSRYEETFNQQAKLPINHKKKWLDLEQQLSSIEQQIVESSGKRSYSILAPVSGTITGIQITVGGRVSLQLPLLRILPKNTFLKAELFLPTRAAGFIRNGQLVQLRYRAFPYQHYGVQNGNVFNITQSILTPSELPIPIPIQEPVYRVMVNLEQQTIHAFGQQFALQSGMLLDADIILETRSLTQWLFEPIYGLYAGNNQ